MIIRVPDLSGDVRVLDFQESGALLNEVLSSAHSRAEQRFDHDVAVHANVYKQGTDVYFSGSVETTVTCTCPRCLEEFEWPLRREFSFLIVKAEPGRDVEDDAGLDHYDSDELDLGRLAREQALLALDDSVLCSDGCRGLCPSCGVNRNHETCVCAAGAQTDSRRGV